VLRVEMKQREQQNPDNFLYLGQQKAILLKNGWSVQQVFVTQSTVFFLCEEEIKAYENWTQARQDTVNCFYLYAEIGIGLSHETGTQAEQLCLLSCVLRSRNAVFSYPWLHPVCCCKRPLKEEEGLFAFGAFGFLLCGAFSL
jgi:hypothetical protein